MLNRNYSSYVKSVKDASKVQKKIQFIRTRQGQTNLLTNFLQNSIENAPTIANAYSLIDKLITTNSDVVLSSEEKIRIVTQMVKEVKKMIDQFYRTGNETASIKMLEDKLTNVVDNIIKDQPQHSLISSYYGVKPVTSSEGIVINNDFVEATNQMNYALKEDMQLVVQLERKTRDEKDVEFLRNVRHKLSMISAQTKEGFDFYEFDRNMQYLGEVNTVLTKKLERISTKNLIFEKLKRIDSKIINEDYNISPDMVKSIEIIRSMARTNFENSDADRMLRELDRIDAWFNLEDVTTNAPKKIEEHLRSKNLIPGNNNDDDDDDDGNFTNWDDQEGFFDAKTANEHVNDPRASAGPTNPLQPQLENLQKFVEDNKELLGTQLYTSYMKRIYHAMTPKDGRFSGEDNYNRMSHEFKRKAEILEREGTPYYQTVANLERFFDLNKDVLNEQTREGFKRQITNLRFKNAYGEFNNNATIQSVKDALTRTIANAKGSNTSKKPKGKRSNPSGSGQHVSFHPSTKYNHINFKK